MPVLAVLAMEVAADAPQRIGERARQVMEKGFFLDRVNCLCTDLSVGGSIQRSFLVQPHTTNPMAAFLNGAAVVAEGAFHRIVFTFCILARFVHENPQDPIKDKSIVTVLYLPAKLLHPFPVQTTRGICSSCRHRPGPYTLRQPERYRGFCRQDNTTYSTTLYEHPVQKLVQ
jgi:hypothetical protein